MKIVFYAMFALLLTSCTKSCSSQTAQMPSDLPDYSQIGFKDHANKDFELEQLAGQYVFISFIFTRCPMPDQCPLTMRLNKRLFRKWQKEKPSTPLHFLVVTIDPRFDTPEVLSRYATNQGLSLKHFTLITGNEKKIETFASLLANVVAFPSGDLISHNTKSILLGPDLKEIREFKDNEWKAEEVLALLKK